MHDAWLSGSSVHTWFALDWSQNCKIRYANHDLDQILIQAIYLQQNKLNSKDNKSLRNGFRYDDKNNAFCVVDCGFKIRIEDNL